MIYELFLDAETVGLIYCSAEANSQYQVDTVKLPSWRSWATPVSSTPSPTPMMPPPSPRPPATPPT
ncbi:MAG: hypothetical protein ACLSAF_21585 [Intestinimonas sp.]